MFDIGLTHIALPVQDVNTAIAFYATYAHMQVVQRRRDDIKGSDVAWLSDRTRPFVIVLMRVNTVASPLLPMAHLGVACRSRAEVDRLSTQARNEGRLVRAPEEIGPPAGYCALLSDADGHTLELSYGQEVGLTLASQLPERGSTPWPVPRVEHAADWTPVAVV